MAAKIIPIIGGYSVQFEQRARGQETPYWIGNIRKDGEKVGTFENRGTGGPTSIFPPEIAKDFERLVDEQATALGFDFDMPERDALVIEFAGMIGYEKQLRTEDPQMVFEEFVKSSALSWDRFTKSLID